MINIFKSHHPVRHAKSFKYAFAGIFHALINEPNFRVEVVIVSIVVAAGLRVGLSNLEWAIIVITMGWLLSAEMINTVVEETVDAFVQEFHEAAKIIKDLAAGYVLITAFVSGFVMLFIFFPHLW